MRKKIRFKYLGWSLFSLFMVFVFHYISTVSPFGNGLKIIAFVGFLINIALAFNINIPYFTDNKKLPKNYNIYAVVITLVLISVLLFFFG